MLPGVTAHVQCFRGHFKPLHSFFEYDLLHICVKSAITEFQLAHLDYSAAQGLKFDCSIGCVFHTLSAALA